MKKIFFRVIESLIIAFLLLQSLLILIPAILHYKCFAVGSDSMAPYLRTGDLIITKSAEFSEIKIGDVITFGNGKNESFFTHRIVEINEGKKWLYTKGDANTVEDPTPTSYDYVIGKVVFSVKFLGYIHFAVNSVYTLIVILVFTIITLLYRIYKLRKRAKNEQA